MSLPTVSIHNHPGSDASCTNTQPTSANWHFPHTFHQTPSDKPLKNAANCVKIPQLSANMLLDAHSNLAWLLASPSLAANALAAVALLGAAFVFVFTC